MALTILFLTRQNDLLTAGDHSLTYNLYEMFSSFKIHIVVCQFNLRENIRNLLNNTLKILSYVDIR